MVGFTPRANAFHVVSQPTTWGCTGARDSLRLRGSKRPFAPSPNHFRGFSYFRPLSQALWFANKGDSLHRMTNRGFGILARNLPGICSELGVHSEFARKTARTSHARNSPAKLLGNSPPFTPTQGKKRVREIAQGRPLESESRRFQIAAT